MGRRKITIKQIPDVKLRHITFNKRKNGLFKKAAELSVLCNLNLLLVCEDGLGNIIQFSRNKITDIKNFLSQCNYQNIIDLTSEDYPDFAKINRKKDKDRDDKEEESESAAEEDEEQPPQQIKTKNTRSFAEMSLQHAKSASENGHKGSMNQNHNYEPRVASQRPKNNKNLNLNLTVPENNTNNGESDSVQKKNKNKLGLRLKIPKAEGAPDAQAQAQVQSQIQNQAQLQALAQAQAQAQAHAQAQAEAQIPLSHQALMNEEASMRAPSSNMDATGMTMDRIRRQADYNSLRSMDKSMDFPASSPFIPFMDPIKRLNGVYDQMTSPFKFYGQNPRMDTLSSMFKGISPFTFPMAGTPLVPKSAIPDEEKIMDTASAMKYMNSRAMMGPETAGSMGGGHKVFTFQADDSMTPLPQINQLATRNEYAMANQRAMYNQSQMQNQVNDYINLPSVMKNDLDFEMNIAPETLSARRFNFSGYFNEFDDNNFSDMRKKHKMS